MDTFQIFQQCRVCLDYYIEEQTLQRMVVWQGKLYRPRNFKSRCIQVGSKTDAFLFCRPKHKINV